MCQLAQPPNASSGAFCPGECTRRCVGGVQLNYHLPHRRHITDREMRDLEILHLTRHNFHGEWNDTVSPTK